MVRWIVKWYLKKRYEDLNYQILSLEQELNYADYIEPNKEIKLQVAHKESQWYRKNLEVVLEIL